MNVRQMIDTHLESGAKATISCLRVPRVEATSFGVAQVDASNRICAFVEKPADPPAVPDDPATSLASMGNYIFDTKTLLKLLQDDAKSGESTHDFGREIVPRLVDQGVAYADDFSQNRIPGSRSEIEHGYWRDVGTIESYYEANLDLKNVAPQLNLYNREWPIHSAPFDDPPAKFVFDEPGRRGAAVQSILSPGCILAGGFAKDCVMGRNVVIHSGAEVSESILMDNVDVGRDAKIFHAIIDKNVRIPAGTRIGYGDPSDHEIGVISAGGIVVIPKDTTIR
jgi:glucose-1-phosphate adenylyltransferase